MSKMSNRLRMNVSLVPMGAKVADIGCDHGYASIWLAGKKIAEYVIAMDVNQGPMEQAREHVKQAGLEDRVVCRLSDGTEKLCPGEVDTLMIAGMGGPLMIRILREGKAVLEQVKTLVLQPQSEIASVRKYVREQGFELAEEKACVEDRKYYFAMRAERRAMSEIEVWNEDWQYSYGTYLVRTNDPVLKQYLLREREKYEQIAKAFHSGERQNERKKELQHKMNEIDQCLAQMQDVANSKWRNDNE